MSADSATQLHSACIFRYDGAMKPPVRKIADSQESKYYEQLDPIKLAFVPDQAGS